MSATRSLAPGVKSHTHRPGPDPARVDIAARHCTSKLHADPPGRVPRQAAPARTGTNSMPYGRPDADPSRPYCGAALTTRQELNSRRTDMGARLTSARKKARRRRHKKTRDKQNVVLEQGPRNGARKP